MKVKLSKQYINKKQLDLKIKTYILLVAPLVIYLASIFFDSRIKLLSLCFITFIFALFALLTYITRIEFLKKAGELIIEVHQDGLRCQDAAVIETLKWQHIKSIRVKRKNGIIKKFKLMTKSGEKFDLSNYSELNELYTEIKRIHSG